MACPRCQGFVFDDHVEHTRQVHLSDPHCVNCGWRPKENLNNRRTSKPEPEMEALRAIGRRLAMNDRPSLLDYPVDSHEYRILAQASLTPNPLSDSVVLA